MKGDFSRITYQRRKRHTAVLLQQGRIVSDADWNEAEAIAGGRIEEVGAETIGPTGAPKADPGFGITPSGGDLTIGSGRYWVDGISCVNETDTLYSSQPHYPAAQLPPAGGAGLYVAYLDVWQRHITALDDPSIRERALGGPDTATRLRTVWQVRLMRVGNPDVTATCDAAVPLWNAALAQTKGTLTARVGPTTSNPDPCELPPGTGYRGLENQLYRVEVHQGADTLAGARFKWSRDNGTVVSTINQFDATGVFLDDLGPDEVLGFAPGQWVEIVDDQSELLRARGQLVELGPINPNTRHVDIVSAFTSVPLPRNPKLRRWDQRGAAATTSGVAAALLAPANTDLGLVLEDGVEVVLGAGVYRDGDYWLIPARTAISAETGGLDWPDDGGSPAAPLALAPHGIEHHYAPLALVTFDGAAFVPTTPPDCRQFFPSLTTLAASDVSVDPEVCSISGATTVQEALDALCLASTGDDLRLHNKMLHGPGVVCGLKVVCNDDRSQVSVDTGYALDCDGYGVHVDEVMDFPIVVEAATQGLLNNTGSGEALLALSRNAVTGNPVLSVVPHQSQSFWEEVLEGTLIKDYYDNAIQSLIMFLKNQFFPIAMSGLPVPTRNRRFAAALNLIIQLINPSSGRYVYLSRAEHDLLQTFYNDLKDIIASETFCAMFDGDRLFPAYPYQEGIRTAFGFLRFHRRLKLHPTRRWAYTCGTGNQISVFDIDTGEQIADLTFPANVNLDVHDVVVSADGNTLHAVAVLNGPSPRDSVFAHAAIAADGTHTWDTQTANVCDFEFVALGVSSQRPGRLLALALSRGLYDFDPFAIPPVPGLPTPSFNATGMLHISSDGRYAYCAEHAVVPVGTLSSTFTRIRRIDLPSPATPAGTYNIPGALAAPDEENDIVLDGTTLWVTGGQAPGHTKTLTSFDPTGIPLVSVDLGVNTVTKLTAVLPHNALLVTSADGYLARRFQLNNGAPAVNFRVPLQIVPMDVATASDDRTVVALNMFSSTLSIIDTDAVLAGMPLPTYTNEPPITLSQYRDAIFDAFSDLLQHLLFYLKDKFCDQFLIKCPACGEDERVILGGIEIRNRSVYKICNFTKRRYVKSFNTYGYWFSTVPILPLAKRLFAKFCCMVF